MFYAPGSRFGLKLWIFLGTVWDFVPCPPHFCQTLPIRSDLLPLHECSNCRRAPTPAGSVFVQRLRAPELISSFTSANYWAGRTARGAAPVRRGDICYVGLTTWGTQKQVLETMVFPENNTSWSPYGCLTSRWSDWYICRRWDTRRPRWCCCRPTAASSPDSYCTGQCRDRGYLKN